MVNVLVILITIATAAVFLGAFGVALRYDTKRQATRLPARWSGWQRQAVALLILIGKGILAIAGIGFVVFTVTMSMLATMFILRPYVSGDWLVGISVLGGFGGLVFVCCALVGISTIIKGGKNKESE